MLNIFQPKQRKFNKEEWLNNVLSRKHFYKDIISRNLLIELSKCECENMLGTKRRKVYFRSGFKVENWTYFLYKNWTGEKYSLMIWFEKNRVLKVTLVLKR